MFWKHVQIQVKLKLTFSHRVFLKLAKDCFVSQEFMNIYYWGTNKFFKRKTRLGPYIFIVICIVGTVFYPKS